METIEDAVDTFLTAFSSALEALLNSLLAIIGDPLIASVIAIFGGGES